MSDKTKLELIRIMVNDFFEFYLAVSDKDSVAAEVYLSNINAILDYNGAEEEACCCDCQRGSV